MMAKSAHTVSAARLEWKSISGAKEDGDIRASYSADTIASQGRIRKPFKWENKLCVAVSFVDGGAEAYALLPTAAFNGAATTYNEKTGTLEKAEAARNDPNGFYHGISVKSGKSTLILCGPPLHFAAAAQAEAPEPLQLTLFQEETMTDPVEGPFRNYSDRSLLIYITAAGDGDPFEMELEAIREAKRRVDAGAIYPQAFKEAMDKNYYAARARDARPKPSPPDL